MSFVFATVIKIMSCDQSIKLSCRIFRDSFHFSGDQVFVFYKRSLGSPKKK